MVITEEEKTIETRLVSILDLVQSNPFNFLTPLRPFLLFSFSLAHPTIIDDLPPIRGNEWSLRAFASMRAVHLFLRARALINFLMRAASALKITNGEQRALRKFAASWNLSLLKRCFAPSNLADTFKTEQQAQS